MSWLDAYFAQGIKFIEYLGAVQTSRPNLNFTGAGVTVADNANNNSTDVSITAPHTASGFCGQGQDGTVTFDGSTSVAGASLAGTTYTLTRDVFYNVATINAGVEVKCANFCFHAVSLTINATGILDNDGASAGVAPNAANAVAAQTLGTNFGGGGGGGAGSGGSAGTNGTNQLPNMTSLFAGGAGGAGGGSAGGAGGTYTALAGASKGSALALPQAAMLACLAAQAGTTLAGVVFSGGAGGGGGGSSAVGTAGGGGGAGGGPLVVAVGTLNNAGRITCRGGAGGAATGNGDGGGGGGGGGGILSLLVGTITALGTVDCNGGAGGAKIGNGIAGSAGQNGLVIQLTI
jgi:hypothetical protein